MKLKYPKATHTITIILILFHIFVLGCWIGNIVQFARCDFKRPYKAEILHGFGVGVPYLSLYTVWLEDK